LRKLNPEKCLSGRECWAFRTYVKDWNTCILKWLERVVYLVRQINNWSRLGQCRKECAPRLVSAWSNNERWSTTARYCHVHNANSGGPRKSWV